MTGALLAVAFALTLTPDREDGLYKSGETVTFTVAGTADGKPLASGQAFRAEWHEGRVVKEKTEFVFDAASPVITRKVEKPGSYLLTLMPLTADGKDILKPWTTPRIGVLCDVDKITKPMDEPYFPKDFDAWWDAEVAAQRKIPLAKATRTPRDVFTGLPASRIAELKARPWYMDALNATDNYDVRIPAAGTNWVAGGMSIPKKPGEKFPALIQFYGVGWDGACACDSIGAAKGNVIIFNVNAHGLPEGATWEEDYPKMRESIEAHAKTKWRGQYPLIGSGEGRENFYYRAMFLRAARAVEYVKTLPEWDGKTIIVHGRSQGAAQAVAAAALAEGVTHVFIGIPAMCDFSGDANDPKRQMAWPLNMGVPVHPESDYFDCVNFAHRIRGKRIHMLYGMVDNYVPATGPAAFFNALPADNDKTFQAIPGMGHDGAACYERLGAMIDEVLRKSR